MALSLFGHLPRRTFHRGINRKFNPIDLPEGYLRDSLNFLPEVPGGIKTLKPWASAGSAAGTVSDLFFYYPRAGGAAQTITRTSGGVYYDATHTITTNVTASGLHSLSLWKGYLVVSEEGFNPVLWDGSTATPLTNAPFGGLSCEFAGRLCNLGSPAFDSNKDRPKAPTDCRVALNIPVVCTGLPLPAYNPVLEGTCTIASGVCTVTYPATFTYNASTMKLVIIGTTCYAITDGTSGTPGHFHVAVVDGNPPDTTTEVVFAIYTTGPLEVYPSSTDSGRVNLGYATVGADTGSVTFRLHNRSSTLSIRIADIRAKGKDWRVTDLPILPYTLPPGGTVAFKVVGNPFSLGTISGTVIIEHDLSAQSSLVVFTTMTGTDTAVIASPSVLDFGEWIASTITSKIKVAIKNPLKESTFVEETTVLAGVWTETGKPTGEVEIKAGESLEWEIQCTPASGSQSSFAVIKRRNAFNRSRLRMSKMWDGNKWNWDEDWVDFDEGDTASGEPIGLLNYDDALLVFKEAEIFYLMVGGEYGFRKSSITLSKGTGAMCQQAITAGAGVVWFLSKAGIFMLSGTSMRRIDADCVDDLVRAVTAGSFTNARAAFCGDYLYAYLPTGTLADGVEESLWAYHGPTESWWRVTKPAAGVVCPAAKRGGTDAPTPYFACGSTIYSLGTGVSTWAWRLLTGLEAMGQAGIVKSTEAIALWAEASETNTWKVRVIGDDRQVMARFYRSGMDVVGDVALPLLAAGVGTAGAGVLTDTDQALIANIFASIASLYVNGVAYPITANDGSTITATGLPALGKTSYLVVASAPSGPRPILSFPREAYGGAPQLLLEGDSSGDVKLYGIDWHLVSMGEPVGQSARW